VLLQGLAGIYFGQGDLTAAHEAALRAVSIIEKQHGRSSTETAQSLGNLAQITMLQGHVAEAEKLFKEAIENLESDSSPDQDSLNELRVGLAGCLLQSGRKAEGIQLFEQSVVFSERAYGADDLRTAQALLGLGRMLSVDKNTRDLARPPLERALQICEAKPGDDASTADALTALGRLENNLGNFTVASRLFARANDIQKRGLAADNHRRAEIAHSAAVSNFDGIDWSIRQRTLEDLLAVRGRLFGERHVLTMISTLELGLHHYFQRNFAIARPLLRSTVTFWEAEQTRDPAAYIKNLVALGMLELCTGNLPAAKISFNKILEQHRGDPDFDVPMMAKTIFFLSEIAWQEHKIEPALEGYERSLSLLRSHGAAGRADGMPAGVNYLPEDHGGNPNDLLRRQLFHELGYRLYQCGDADAGLAYEQALQFDPEQLGPDDFGLPLEIVQGAATLNGTPANKNFREALDRIIREREIKLGGDHPATHAARSIMAPILYNLGLAGQANAVMVDAVIAQMRLLGIAHPWTQRAKIRCDQILEAQHLPLTDTRS
jgi:tetratricopeptide (TPR) repeat protein